MLKDQFLELFSKYSDGTASILELWREIEDSYGKTYRHYHTLSHLSHFFEELDKVKPQILDWDCCLMAMFYHDVVFLPTRNDNEKSSSDVAAITLALLGIPSEKIEKCQQLIMATKKHLKALDSDTNFFTDADLAIIGSEEKLYKAYLNKIEQEYYYLSEEHYRVGRIKVIDHLLGMDQLYKTQHFFVKYEQQARRNLKEERKKLS